MCKLLLQSPTPQISWRREGNKDLPMGRIRCGPEGSTLRIRHITFEDAGQYTCMAFNDVGGPTINYTVNVDVVGM